MKYIASLILALMLLPSPKADAQIGSWIPLPIPPGLPQLYDIGMADRMFGFACGESDINHGYTGVLMTFDGGLTWGGIPDILFDPPLDPTTVWRAVVIIDRNTAIVAGDSTLMYRTTDAGMSWKRVPKLPFPKSKPTIRSMYCPDGQTVVAVGGDSFTTLPPPTPPNPPDPTYPLAILRSTDQGATWYDESMGPGKVPGDPALFRVHYANNSWVACGEMATVVYRDPATGSWSKMVSPSFFQEDLTGLAVTDTKVWWTSGGEANQHSPHVYQTTDGGSRFIRWTPAGPWGIDSYSGMYFFNSRYGWVGAHRGEMAVTTNGGNTWKKFSLAGQYTMNPIRRMVFTDSLNGWALGSDYIIRYTGVPPKPDISATDQKVTFDEITCQRYIDTTLVIRNNGTGTLVIQNTDITFTSFEFSLVGVTFPIKLDPGRGKAITIRWRPGASTTGSVTASMTVYSNDPDHPAWPVTLNARRNHGVLILDTAVYVQAGVCVRDSSDYFVYGIPGGSRTPRFIKWEFVSGNDEFRLYSPQPGTDITSAVPFYFRFSPTQPGTRRGYYRVIAGDPSCPDTSVIKIEGTGNRTHIITSLSTIDFGKLCVKSVKDTVITIKNTGNTYALVSRRELASGVDMFPSAENTAIVVNVDSVKQYRLRFAPTLKGKFDAVYRIISEPCADTALITLKGEGIATEIEFDPSGSVTVGPTNVGKYIAQTVTIRNSGDTPANLTSVRLANTFPDLQLLAVPPMPMLLAPGQGFTVLLQYLPTKLGTLTTSLNVAWSSVCSDTARLPVFAPCVPNPFIVAQAAMDAGVQKCPTPIRDTTWIRNLGNGPLVFLALNLAGKDTPHFRVISPAVGDSVKAKDSTRLIIEYNRPTEGTSATGLTLVTNDDDRSPTSIALTGTRTVREFTIQGDSSKEFFTRLFVPETRSFTVRNTGTQPLDISTIEVLKANAVFQVTPGIPLPALLDPGMSMTFDIVFTPNARGPFNGQIRVVSLPCNTPSLVDVTGRGDVDGLSLDKGNMDYLQSPCEYASLCDTLRLNNLGTEPVTVSSIVINQPSIAFMMTQLPTLPLVLGPGKEEYVIICADPSFLGRNQGTLVVTSNDPVYPKLQVALTSTRDSVRVTVSNNAVDFGRLSPCDATNPRAVIVSNTGTKPESISATFTSGTGFTTTFGPGVVLPAGRSYSFNIDFMQTTTGVYDDTLLVHSDGCDRTERIVLHAERVAQSYAVAPSTLSYSDVNLGSSSVLPVNVQNNGGFDAHVASITIRPTGAFLVDGTPPTSIGAGASASVQIRFKPYQEGAASATACIIIDSPCPDTLCIALEGAGIRGALTLSSPDLKFGTQVQCVQTVLSDTLRNEGSGTTMLLGANISGTGQSAFTNLTPISTPESLPPGASRIFRIRYDAALVPADGPVTALLTVQTDIPAQPAIDLPLSAGKATMRAAVGASLSFGTIEINQPQQRLVRLVNNGSVRYCYNASAQSPQVTFTPSLPICIEPGQFVDVSVRLLPDVEGFYSGRLSLRADAPCADSTIVLLDATVQRGGLTQSPTVRDLGTLSSCEVSNFDVLISNTYLEDATLDSVRIEGPDAVFFTITSPTGLPLPIAAGGKQSIVMSFTGQNIDRTYNAQLVSYLHALGSAITRRTDLIAETRRPLFTVTSIAFPTAIIGQPALQGRSVVRNISTVPIEISLASTADPSFVITGSVPTIPSMLQPGDSLVLTVEFRPATAATFSDSVVVISRKPCFIRDNAPITGTAIPRAVVKTIASVSALSGKPDDHVLIPIMIDKDISQAEVDAWSGGVQFNHSMLYPIRVVKEGTLSAGMTVTMTDDPATNVVKLAAQGARITGTTRTLAYLECLVLIGDSAQTAVSLTSDFAFLSGYATVESRTSGSFTLTGYCLPGDRLIKNRGVTKLAQNTPNPVSLSSAGSTHIQYSLASDGWAEISLHDALGRHVRTLVSSMQSAGTHEVTLPVTELPAGVYMYTLRTGDAMLTRQLVVTQ